MAGRTRRLVVFILSIIALFILQLPGNDLSEIPKKLQWQELWSQPFSKHFAHLVLAWYHLNIIVFLLCVTSWSIAAELMFRGYLMPRMNIIFKSKIAAITCSSMIYALFPFRGNSLKWLIKDFFSGIFFGIHYQKYHNIKILIVTRILIDVIFACLMRQSLGRMNF
ncbi:CPBP family glutamic-type intramembrane protease [uncultured Mucilaginibacter sp.]|uniref:CPBP family glutamic-type intramembrane protease n=1 Tax=uncultured Mucilaginibacter sp. TaxID=797541 RepID=UPI00345C3451